MERMNILFRNANRILRKYDNDFIRPRDTFYSNFERYIFHAVEEVYEARTEEDLNPFIEEVADILNYVATMKEILFENAYCNGFMREKKSNLFKTNNNQGELNLSIARMQLSNIYDLLISMRREFPERKWHKKETGEPFQVILLKCNHICNVIINELFKIVDYNTLINVAIEKQVKIFKL